MAFSLYTTCTYYIYIYYMREILYRYYNNNNKKTSKYSSQIQSPIYYFLPSLSLHIQLPQNNNLQSLLLDPDSYSFFNPFNFCLHLPIPMKFIANFTYYILSTKFNESFKLNFIEKYPNVFSFWKIRTLQIKVKRLLTMPSNPSAHTPTQSENFWVLYHTRPLKITSQASKSP